MTLTKTIAEIERLLAEATPGPMKATSKLTDVDGIPHEAICSESKHCGFALTEEVNDAALIVALVNAAPQLIEAAKRGDKYDALTKLYGRSTAREEQQQQLAAKYRNIAERLQRSGFPNGPDHEEGWEKVIADLDEINKEMK